MATVSGDENGVIETCDEASASCDDCDFSEDGDGVTVIARAEEHADDTGHTITVSGTYYGTVSP